LIFFEQDLQRLVEALRLTHELLSEHIAIDPFNLMMGEISETISLVSFSGRMASQVSLKFVELVIHHACVSVQQ
jgi:hypothetical protein